jgi:outer membrane protein
LQANLQKASQDAQTKAQQKYGELINPILEKVQTTIEQVAKEEGYTYIFKVETILYEPTGSDISSLVGKKMGVVGE